jgi:hypothetical protein
MANAGKTWDKAIAKFFNLFPQLITKTARREKLLNDGE